MKKAAILAAIAGVIIAMETAPAQAQMDYLTPHLETQRWNNLQRHQQQIRRNNRQRARANRSPVVQVNGERLRTPVPAMEVNGTTFVPMRSIFEALGATVSYDGQDRMVTAERGRSFIQLPLEGGRASVNNRPVRLGSDQRPFVYQGVTMVPLRFVSEGMGARVDRIARIPAPPLIQIRGRVG